MTALEHNHHPSGEFRTPEDKQRARIARCPICSQHDHSDRRAFCLDRDMQEVPAYFFNCPRCGTAESQVHAHRWTEAGMAWIKDNADFDGTWHVEHKANQTREQAA